MASADEIFKYIGLSIDVAKAVVEGAGLAIKAFSTGNVDEGFDILRDTIRQGDAKIAELHARREKVYAENQKAIDEKFDHDMPPAVHADKIDPGKP